jgi:hypothetical protein
MLPRAFILLALAPLFTLAGCQTTVEEHEHPQGEACTHEEDSARIEHPTVKRTQEGGVGVLLAGESLEEAAEVPEVTVAALLDSPEAYAGQRVRVTGDVSAMCHHKRGWFALVAPDQSGRNLRVLTAPTFLVPEGVIGMNASTEGVVELIEIPAEEARHYAKEHKLGDPAAITGPVKRAVIRAAGAAFRQA